MKRAKLEIDLDYDLYRLIKDLPNTADGSNDVRTFASEFVDAIKNSKLITTYEKCSYILFVTKDAQVERVRIKND